MSSESFNPSRVKNKFEVLVVNARHAACQLSEMTEGKGLGETTQLQSICCANTRTWVWKLKIKIKFMSRQCCSMHGQLIHGSSVGLVHIGLHGLADEGGWPGLFLSTHIKPEYGVEYLNTSNWGGRRPTYCLSSVEILSQNTKWRASERDFSICTHACVPAHKCTTRNRRCNMHSCRCSCTQKCTTRNRQ